MTDKDARISGMKEKERLSVLDKARDYPTGFTNENGIRTRPSKT